MFKTEYELFEVNLVMTSFMFRPDGYFRCFMMTIISAMSRTIIIGALGGAFQAHVHPPFIGVVI